MTTIENHVVKFISREPSAWAGWALLKKMIDGMVFQETIGCRVCLRLARTVAMLLFNSSSE